MRAVRVRNEFGALRAALVHDAGNAVDTTIEDLRRLIPADELKDHPESGPSFKDRIFKQQADFRRVLADHGVSLLSPDTREDAFCQVFTRDPCFVVGDTLFVGSLRDAYRHPEIAGLAQLRGQVETVGDLSGGGARIEGGDVMVLDEGLRVLVGMNWQPNSPGRVSRSSACRTGLCTSIAVWPLCRTGKPSTAPANCPTPRSTCCAGASSA